MKIRLHGKCKCEVPNSRVFELSEEETVKLKKFFGVVTNQELTWCIVHNGIEAARRGQR